MLPQRFPPGGADHVQVIHVAAALTPSYGTQQWRGDRGEFLVVDRRQPGTRPVPLLKVHQRDPQIGGLQLVQAGIQRRQAGRLI